MLYAWGMDEQAARAALAEVRDQIKTVEAGREALIIKALRAGVNKTDIADAAGISRTTVYDVIRREEEIMRTEAKARAEREFPEVLKLWKLGQVVEDRWGLRWRADTKMVGAGQDGWQCRSVGLRLWRNHEQLAERGPLKPIRIDRLGGKTDWSATKAEDAAITVNGDQAETGDNPTAKGS